MKNLIIGAASFVIALLLIMTVYTFQGREARNEEIHDGLSNALSAAGEQMKESGAYESDGAFEAAFVENLMQQLDSSSNVEVSVLSADSEKGVISAEVTETYQHPNKEEGKVSCKRTLILDREDESLIQEKKSYPVSFYLDQYLKEEELYKSSILLEGEQIRQPQAPEKEGYTFVEWRDARTKEKAVFEEETGIHEDKIYYAVWKEEP